MSVRRTGVEKLKEARRRTRGGDNEPIEMTFEGLLLLLLDGNRSPTERQINPTQQRFIYSPSRVKAYMGPAGVAKTSTACAAGMMRALFQPGSKGMVGRQDYNDLMDTTALRMQEMMERLPKGILLDRDKSAPMKWWIRPIDQLDEDGNVLDSPSQITFMGLKESLGSYEFDWEIVDEADEIDEKRAHELTTRLRGPTGGRYGYASMFFFNPPDKEHWLYQACTGKDAKDRQITEPWIDLFTPVPNENSRNLPTGYHDELAKNLPEDMKARLIRGEWGGTFPGRPVYPEFRAGLHTKDLSESYDPYSTLYRFWDFGYNHPVCLFAQLSHQGHLKVIREFIDERVEIQPFVKKVKAQTSTHFPNATHVIDFGDPAARQKKDTGSTLVELRKEDIILNYVFVDFDTSIRDVRMQLSQLIAGEPAIQIDTRGCSVLYSALRGGYHMDEATGTKPVKDGYYDNVADAFRYGVCNLFKNRGVDVSSLPTSMRYRARGTR